MWILDAYEAFGCACLVSILGLALLARVSPRARRYARRHPWRAAALGLMLAAANVAANKPPVAPPEVKQAVRLRLLGLPGRYATDDPALEKYRPLDFRILAK